MKSLSMPLNLNQQNHTYTLMSTKLWHHLGGFPISYQVNISFNGGVHMNLVHFTSKLTGLGGHHPDLCIVYIVQKF